ncbi:DNA gyrase subunit A [Candidatus Woesearchaeota archaeon]|nr:DNA gyrase subunit A [Candidatus Woesearchaeota archaeon]
MEEVKEKIQERIVPQIIEEEMKKSYLDYSMSVIVGRALPDVRDGLKPVHRRILYAMYKMGMFHNKPFKKCARIVGEVLGKFHPHGDMAVYDALVRMVQTFSLRYPLIRGQGNFGSIDGDSAAAMRYTEAKLSKLSEEMLQDIEKNTVKFIDNFDGSLKEPTFLPSKLPNLLINGSSGIAVGMATNIPPHNLGEVADGVIKVIDHPEISIEELMQIIEGPDFPTAGIILGRKGIQNAYATGRGRIRVRAKTEIEEGKKKRIIVNELPYTVNKALLLEEIADLVRQKKISGIADLRDESDREGIRVIIALKQDATPQIVLNQLFKHTKMQITFGVNTLALVGNEPKVLNLKQLIQQYIEHRKGMIRKRTEFDLAKASHRVHILEGLIVALDNIDKTIEIVKKSKEVEEAKKALMSNFNLSDEQAQAILDMKLQRLTGLEQGKIKKEKKDLVELIEELKAILASEQKILDIIKEELNELKEKYGDERRTEIVEEEEEEITMEELIAPEDVVITISHSGYIKRQAIGTYKKQRRGGRGVIAAGTREEDFLEDLFIANTHDYILFFTNEGKVHWLKVYEIPEGTRQAKGKAIVNLLRLVEKEKITAFIPVNKFEGFLAMVTKRGVIKKTALKNFSNPRRGGIVALSLDEGDELIDVIWTDGTKQLIIATKNGQAVKFKEEDVRDVGRTARGVRGIRLKEDDEVVDEVLAEDEKTLLTVTENGYGKRTKISEYRLISRGGSGVKNIICSKRNGKVVAIKSVEDSDELMLISKHGIMIRVPAKDISVVGRATQGVTIMDLDEGDKVAAVATIAKED